uniref:Rab-GAP TBC domain-containing protein n=1 Tax=Daucus carota subsp. sativus TaxID=79200 RepID=A0A162AFN8_DAUCS
MGPLTVSPMGFGTWAWGNQLLWGYQESMDDELQQIFNLAVENGVNLFDTADSYGTGKLNGQSEKLLGKFIREYQGRKQEADDVVIATKFAAYPWRLTPGQFVNACKGSLDRMQIEQIGIGQLHWSTANYAPLQEKALWDGLVAMYDKGLVQAVGVSNYGPKQLLKIYEYLQARGVPLCSAQVQFSLLSMGEDQMEIKTICDSLGIRLISYSPLGLGMLTGKYTPSTLPSGPRGLLFKQIIPGLEPLLDSLGKIAQRRRKTIPQVAINWCISKGTVPIPGVKTLKQARENLGALGWYLSSDEVLELESAARESPRKMIQNVFQTSYDLNSSKEERDNLRTKRRKEYEKLRRHCRRLLKLNNTKLKLTETGRTSNSEEGGHVIQGRDSADSEDVVSARESLSSEDISPSVEYLDDFSHAALNGCDGSKRITDPITSGTESSDSDSSVDVGITFSSECNEENDPEMPSKDSPNMENQSKTSTSEDFATWQRIIRLDAIRANEEWVPYSPSQAAVSEERARRAAEVVGLKDYDHLEPYKIYHAARLVAILEAYALYDPEIGYCQGMSDLLSPIITVMTEDHEAFWCFVGFMKKARHNFRLDEVGIRGQLERVSKIIKFKDSHLFKHLEKLQAEDCFFVYRMVVVLFRRELTFEQTICLWEVMWADQAAIRAGIGKSAWSRIRQQAPPTEDLLLYAVAASVLKKRKLIIEKYSSMDEIVRECNGMAGHLDVWKLLDDAHNLVVTLHNKIENPLPDID